MIPSSRGSFGGLQVEDSHAVRWSLPSAAEMAAFDRATIDRGVSSLELMERAGSAIAERLMLEYPTAQQCVVLCGPGNNGGDGLVIARVLRANGRTVQVVVVSAERYSPECVEQMRRCGDLLVHGTSSTTTELTGSPFGIISDEELRSHMASSDLIVDALLGTGQRAAPRDGIASMVSLMCGLRETGAARVVSVDIPTGVCADSGMVFEPHVIADRTYCIEFIKRGLLQFPARSACGSIVAMPIGISAHVEPEFMAVEGEGVPTLSARAPDAHKGQLGRILVIGGSARMPGAAVLSALGALRAGAGIVSRVAKRSWGLAPALPECMFELIDGDEDFFVGADAPTVIEIARRFDVLVVGPGMGTAPETGAFLKDLVGKLRGLETPVVLDADALNSIAEQGIDITGVSAIVTPHPGEAGRLLQQSVQEVQSDRYSAARALWQRLGVVVVMKGAGTIVYGEGRGRVVARGTPYLATPGSGDVLTGVIAACCARLPSLMDAATLGAWLHATAGIRAAEERQGPLLASEIALAVAPVVGVVEGR